MKISFSNSDNPSINFSLSTLGGHEKSGFTDVISAIDVIGIISEGTMTEVVVVEISVVEVVEVGVVIGMNSVSRFIFCFV